MINANRPILNLDLDLLRTFVAVADLNTFAAAAAAVRRTQSAVSQQMQRLEQLVGKELLLAMGAISSDRAGYSAAGLCRKILRFNDEACMSLMFSSLQGTLTVGASDETADTILPFLLNRIGSVYPRLTLEIKVKQCLYRRYAEEKNRSCADHPPSRGLIADAAHFANAVVLRSGLCPASGESVPLVLLDDPDPVPR
jgi:hypothetical protein